jgi:hypothetical protein
MYHRERSWNSTTYSNLIENRFLKSSKVLHNQLYRQDGGMVDEGGGGKERGGQEQHGPAVSVQQFSIPAVKHVMSSRFMSDASRIEELWEELQVPLRDRHFFKYVYMRKVTHENCGMIADQLNLLIKHRDNTIEVLRALRGREEIFNILQGNQPYLEVECLRCKTNTLYYMITSAWFRFYRSHTCQMSVGGDCCRNRSLATHDG